MAVAPLGHRTSLDMISQLSSFLRAVLTAESLSVWNGLEQAMAHLRPSAHRSLKSSLVQAALALLMCARSALTLRPLSTEWCATSTAQRRVEGQLSSCCRVRATNRLPKIPARRSRYTPTVWVANG